VSAQSHKRIGKAPILLLEQNLDNDSLKKMHAVFTEEKINVERIERL